MFGFWCPKTEDFVERSKFTDSRIALILRQVEEGTSVDEVCRKTGYQPALQRYPWTTLMGGSAERFGKCIAATR